jgi:hypothetical protein
LGCDISIFGKGWCIVKDLNEIIYCHGLFLASGCSDEVACHLSNAISILEFPGTSIKPILVPLNQVLASDDPQQVETLIGTSQLMHNGVAVDMAGPICFSQMECPRKWNARHDREWCQYSIFL